MPTARVLANTAAQLLLSVPKHQKAKITSIDIDNQGVAARTVRLQDIFTPDVSAGEPSPTPQTKERFQATVGSGVSFSADELSLKDLEFLGDVKAIASAIDPSCVVIVKYHFV
jgi:hypothetical protein